MQTLDVFIASAILFVAATAATMIVDCSCLFTWLYLDATWLKVWLELGFVHDQLIHL